MTAASLSRITCLTLGLFCCSAATGQEDAFRIAREYFTEYGVLTFAPRGSRVTGSYPRGTRRIVGKLDGRVLNGSWQGNGKTGAISITFAQDFSTFKARYNHAQTSDKWETDWTGMVRPRLETRMYETEWGVLTCIFEGSQLSCVYPWYNGKILGELQSTTFTGLWLQSNGGVGNLRLSFAGDYSSFKGTYNDFNYHPERWTEWTGRISK